MFGFKKKKKIIKVINGNIPLSEETQAENSVMAKKKKAWKLLLITIIFPLFGILQLLFWLGINYKIIVFNDDMLKTIFNAIFLLLGFSTNTRFNLANLRDSKSLANIRISHYWLIMEYTTFINVVSLSICALLSIIDILTLQHSILVFSIIITVFIMALIYSGIALMAGRHVNKYM